MKFRSGFNVLGADRLRVLVLRVVDGCACDPRPSSCAALPLVLESSKKTPHLVHVCVLPSATIGCASLSSDPVSRRLISFHMFDFTANLVGEFPRVLYFILIPRLGFGFGCATALSFLHGAEGAGFPEERHCRKAPEKRREGTKPYVYNVRNAVKDEAFL